MASSAFCGRHQAFDDAMICAFDSWIFLQGLLRDKTNIFFADVGAIAARVSGAQ
jgi:hypothetical protein